MKGRKKREVVNRELKGRKRLQEKKREVVKEELKRRERWGGKKER